MMMASRTRITVADLPLSVLLSRSENGDAESGVPCGAASGMIFAPATRAPWYARLTCRSELEQDRLYLVFRGLPAVPPAEKSVG